MNQNPETPSAVPDVKEEEKRWVGIANEALPQLLHASTLHAIPHRDYTNRAVIIEAIRASHALEKKEAVAESVALREAVDQMNAVCAACPVNPSEGKWEICKQCGTTWERRGGKLYGSRHLQGGGGRMCFPSREQWETWRKRLAEWEQGAVSGLRDVQGPTELLPCPFDGKPATSCFMPSGVPGMEDCGYWACGCARCSGTSQAIEFHGDSKEEVEFLWNKRAASSVPEGPKSDSASGASSKNSPPSSSSANAQPMEEEACFVERRYTMGPHP